MTAGDGQEHRRQGHDQALPTQGEQVLFVAVEIDSHGKELDLPGHDHQEPTARIKAIIGDPPRRVGIGRRVGRGRFGNGHAGGKVVGWDKGAQRAPAHRTVHP